MSLNFEGPVPAPGVPCAVLRCGGGEETYVLRLPGMGGEVTVCRSHHDAIIAGERWAWEGKERRMLMGSDRTGDGRFVATDASVAQRMDGDSALGWNTLVVDFEDEDGETLRVTMNRDLAATLGIFS